MIAAKVCQLHETFQWDWSRDFPNGPKPVLDGIDDVIRNQRTSEEATFASVVSASVNERLNVTNENIDIFREQLHREVVVKQFLVRVLEILDPSVDFSAQIATIHSQVCYLSSLDSFATTPRYNSEDNRLGLKGARLCHKEGKKLNPNRTVATTLAGSVDKASEPPKFLYSQSLKLNSPFIDKRSADVSSTLPRLCYSNSNKNNNTKQGDKKINYSCSNLVESSEYDEMFKRKKNTPKSSDGDSGNNYTLGAKDNFLAVKAKHNAPSVHPRQQDGNLSSPQLTRNFQLLKLTDGYDLVLGDSSAGGDITDIDKKREDGQQKHSFHGDQFSTPDTSKSQNYPEKIPQESEINQKYVYSSQITPSATNNENITTIQVRKPEVRVRKDLGSEGQASGSEGQPTCETSSQENSTLVRRPAPRGDGYVADDSQQIGYISEQRFDHSQSFQNSLRKFSTKGSGVPPPVAKKPVRSGSNSSTKSLNKVPSFSTVGERSTGLVEEDRSVPVSGVVASQSLQEFKYTNSSKVLNCYKSDEEISGGDSRDRKASVTSLFEAFEVIINTLQQEEDESQEDSPKPLQVEEGTDKDCVDLRDNSLQLSLESGDTVLTSEVIKESDKEDTEMSCYRLQKSSSRNSSARNSIENLVEGIGFSMINIQKSVDDVSKASIDVSPPELPCKMPIHSHDSDYSRGEDNADCHILITAASREAEDIVFDGETNLTIDFDDVSHASGSANQSERPDVPELYHKTKKRLSSTPSYENWTINRAITTSSADCFSVSDDDELDEPPLSPVAESRPTEQNEVAFIGSNDSELCDNIDSSEVSHSNSDIIKSRGREKTDIPQVDHRDGQVYEPSLCDTTYLETDLTNEVAHGRAPERRRQREEDVTETLSVDGTNVDTLSVPSDGDEEASHGMDSSCDETDSARDGMLKMRQLLVKGVLDSEKGYLGILNLLLEYKRILEASSLSSQPVIAKEDVQTIFSNIETIHQVHVEFVHSLEAKVANWSHEEQVGEIFKIMISKMIEFGGYLNNYHQAVSTIHKCCLESERFQGLATHMIINSTVKEVTSLEDALFKPVQRLQRNTLVLHDLIKYTPEDHPDHYDLLKALKLSQRIIESFDMLIPQSINTPENRRLVKSSFLVEDVGGVRKLRYIFLFSDVLVCTKREIRRNNKVTFEIKWFAPLMQSTIDTKFSYSDEGKSSTKDDITELKAKLKGLKRELKTEIRKSDDKDRHRTLVSLGGGGTRNVEKLRKKINQAEAQLILASPKLPFKVVIEGGRPYTLLMSTDYEREEWKEAVAALFRKLPRADQSTQTMSSILIQELINNVKETPQVNKIGNVLLKKDEDLMTGVLNVTIHKFVNRLAKACDTYCNIEMDSFGHFFFKARTTICERTQDPAWNEDFDLELEGSETLRILCFKKEPGGQGDTLLGRGALELNQQWLKGSFQEKTLSMNEISLVISMRHIPADKTMQRTPSRTNSAVFGVSISSCAKREGKTVPMIVKSCVQEVEKRGLDEVGIYRVSGVSSDLQHIKRLIDKNARSGTILLQDADIHSVTGVLKLYLRELPEPLFTEANYNSFVDTLKLCDEEAKTQCMLSLLHGLPDTNYYTIVYLLEHLINVAKQVAVNKMSIHNLSTIFGPTLLAPATKQTSTNPLEMMCKGAEEVMLQSSVINFLLGLAISGKSLRRSAQ